MNNAPISALRFGTSLCKTVPAVGFPRIMFIIEAAPYRKEKALYIPSRWKAGRYWL